MKTHITNLIGSLIALAGHGAANLNAAFQPAASWRGATPAKHRKEKVRYATALENHWSKKRRAAMPKVGVLRDEHGAYTLTGRGIEADITGRGMRRKWLAGISAQRGY